MVFNTRTPADVTDAKQRPGKQTQRRGGKRGSSLFYAVKREDRVKNQELRNSGKESKQDVDKDDRSKIDLVWAYSLPGSVWQSWNLITIPIS